MTAPPDSAVSRRRRVWVRGLAALRGSVPLASAVAERAPLYGALVPAAWGPASPANGPAAEVPARPH